MAEKEGAPKSGGFSFLGAVGFLAFIAGIVLSIVAGIMVEPRTITQVRPEILSGPAKHPETVAHVVLALAILGIIVGLLNITAKEVMLLMVAAIALLVVGQAGTFDILDRIARGFGTHITDILTYFGKLMTPAAVIAAVRALFAVGFPG
jgi:hypothetical protein